MTQHSVCHSVSISQDVQSIGTGDHKAVLCDIALIEFYDVTVRDAYCFILHLLLPTISAHTSNAPFLHALPRINASVCIYSSTPQDSIQLQLLSHTYIPKALPTHSSSRHSFGHSSSSSMHAHSATHIAALSVCVTSAGPPTHICL